MKKLISIALCLLLILSCALPVTAASDVPQEVMEATKSVVRILSRYSRSASTGSGFVIKNDGEEVLIATNNHVVEGNPLSIAVWVAEDELVDAEIVFTTAQKDLCVLRLLGKVDMKPLTMATEAARQGQAIYAVGYPGVGDVLSDSDAHTSEAATITDGIISAIRTFTIEEGADPAKLLQINAAINPGNSGGPLFNAKGEVIGVNTYKVNKDSQGIFGAVDISELWTLLERNHIEIPEETVPETLAPEASPAEAKPFPVGILAACLAVAALAVMALVFLHKKDRKQPGKPGKRSMTLRAYVSAHPGGLGVGGAVSLLLPAAIQLRNLHNDGKLHLQVNPDNILVGDEARLKGPSGQESGRFGSGFAAPEVYRGAGFGIASDIYSFAAVLYYAATGREPANSLQREQLDRDLSQITDAAFVQVLCKAMAFAPQDRTQSMQELIYAIAVFNVPAQEEKEKFAAQETVPAEKTVSLNQAATTDVIASQSADWRGNPSSKRKIPVILTAVLACVLLSVFLPWKPNAQKEETTLEAPQETTIPATTPESIPETTVPLSPEAMAYAEAEKLLADGETAKAAIAFGKLAGYEDARERSFELWDKVVVKQTISASNISVGLKKDGTVLVAGDKFEGDVSTWSDIVSVDAGRFFVVGLKSDGTVVAEGNDSTGRSEIDGWTDIVSVSSADFHTVGLKCDGTVVATAVTDSRFDYGQCDVAEWTDIVAICAGREKTIGLKSDGTVVVTQVSDPYSEWSDVIAIDIGTWAITGLKADGSVLVAGNEELIKGAKDWSEIVAIAAATSDTSAGGHLLGLKADGTVTAVGDNRWKKCNVDTWSNIVAISGGTNFSLALKEDGTVISAGVDWFNCRNVSGWTDIKLPTSASIPKLQPKVEETPGQPAAMGLTVMDPGDKAGAYVTNVEQGKAAQRASLAVGDIITRLDDYPITNVTDLTRALQNFQAGDVAYVTVLREGTELEFAIIFDAKPE